MSLSQSLRNLLYCAPAFALWISLPAPVAHAQGGRAAQTAPATQTTPATPAAPSTPAVPAPAAQAGRGRGGIAGPGPAVGGEISETPVVTHHTITVGGKTINYTATVAQMPLKDSAGETEAHIFYVAYTQDGVTDTAKRPLTFCFNGGPGSPSMWVHLGGMGPRSPKLAPNGGMLPPPYQMKDNQDTWLEQTDLVFLDPVGHRLQPREERGSGAPHERRAGRYPIGRRVHAHVHRAARSANFRPSSSLGKATARSAPRAWPAT